MDIKISIFLILLFSVVSCFTNVSTAQEPKDRQPPSIVRSENGLLNDQKAMRPLQQFFSQLNKETHILQQTVAIRIPLYKINILLVLFILLVSGMALIYLNKRK